MTEALRALIEAMDLADAPTMGDLARRAAAWDAIESWLRLMSEQECYTDEDYESHEARTCIEHHAEWPWAADRCDGAVVMAAALERVA